MCSLTCTYLACLYHILHAILSPFPPPIYYFESNYLVLKLHPFILFLFFSIKEKSMRVNQWSHLFSIIYDGTSSYLVLICMSVSSATMVTDSFVDNRIEAPQLRLLVTATRMKKMLFFKVDAEEKFATNPLRRTFQISLNRM